jgi:hypothetical protein
MIESACGHERPVIGVIVKGRAIPVGRRDILSGLRVLIDQLESDEAVFVPLKCFRTAGCFIKEALTESIVS